MTWDEVCRRAGGRRRYNYGRRVRAMLRRKKVGELMNQLGWFTTGIPAQVARLLGVSRSTVCRDLRWIERDDPCRAPGQRRPTVSRRRAARAGPGPC